MLLAAGSTAATASAHAQLLRSYPAPDSELVREPSHVSFTFAEAVELPAIGVFDARGRAVATSRVVHPRSDPRRILVWLRRRLPRGAYRAAFRVLSDDGHVEVRSISFRLGIRGGPAAAPGGLRTAGAVTVWMGGAARLGEYLALAVVLGGIAFLRLVWLPALDEVATADPRWSAASAAFARRRRRVLRAAVRVGACCATAVIALEAAAAGGVSAWSAVARPPLLWRVIWTHAGLVMAAVAAAWLTLLAIERAPVLRAPELRRVALGADGLAAQRARGAGVPVLATALAVLVAAPALAGHAWSLGPALVLVPVASMHVLAMSVWLGGLLALASTVPAAAGELPVAERRSLWVGVVTRFSDVAVRAFPVLLGTGALQAIAYLPGPAAILSGAYGRMVGVKLLLACALLGVAWGNRRRSSAGRLAAPATAAAVRRAVVAELALAGAVLVVTASLVATAPPGVPMR